MSLALVVDESRFATRPDKLTKLRACKTCKLLKTAEQFYASYCDNCTQKWPEQDSAGRREEYVAEETTTDWVGTVAMMQPQSSWVARWLRMHYMTDDGKLVPLKPGVYAIRLPGVELAMASGAAEPNEEDEYEDEEGDDVEEETLGSGHAGGVASARRVGVAAVSGKMDTRADDDGSESGSSSDSDSESSGSDSGEESEEEEETDLGGGIIPGAPAAAR